MLHANEDGPQRQALVLLLLVVILVAGTYLRFVGHDWDSGHLLHPDERFLSWVTSDMREPGSLAEFFDTQTSTFNPNNVGHQFYVYGTLPVFLGYYAGQLVDKTTLFDVYLPGRTLSALFDLISVVFVFLTARRLFNWRAGLLAAALYAGAALPVQLSHFYAVDTFAAAFVAICLYFAARTLDARRWYDFALFGISLGLGMACKVSIFPLGLILALAALLGTVRKHGWLPGAAHPDDTLPTPPRPLLDIIAVAGGLILAAGLALAVFRVAQPYAFLPPQSEAPIDEASLGSGMALISRIGNPIGLRPNPAWLAQMQEVRRQVSGNADIPPNHQWGKRIPLVFPWINMVRVGLGWPLGVFAWLSVAWALWEIARGHQESYRLIPVLIWAVLIFVWQGSGWVTTVRYFLPIYGSLMILAGWALVTFGDRASGLVRVKQAPRWSWPSAVSVGLIALVVSTAFAWSFAVTRIYTRTHPRIAASEWIVEHVPADVTLSVETEEGVRSIQIGLPNDWDPPDQPLDDETRPAVRYSVVPVDVGKAVRFVPDFNGELTRIRLNHVVAANNTGDQGRLTVEITRNLDGAMLFQGRLEGTFEAVTDPRGEAYDLVLDEPVLLEAGAPYFLMLKPEGIGLLVTSGSSIATEGDWDDPVPQPVRDYNLWGAMYQGYQLQLFWDDVDYKRERLQYVLDHTDYLTISSNRFYRSLTRNPARFPMTIDYYEALFSGELGFELIADFTSRPSLGLVEFHDDDVDEAWTVYDHPRVMVFRKTEAYSAENTARILGQADLDSVVRLIARDAPGRPVYLDLPDSPSWPAESGLGMLDDPATYDPTRTDLWSTFQPLTVLVWWLVLALIGWAAFPLLYLVFPGLPDRGYSAARVFGLLLSAWLSWLLASVRLVVWSPAAILGSILAMAVIAAALCWPRRLEFRAWLRESRGYVLRFEVILALMYLAFVLIRWGNPDLWHPFFGGEKPMDFAYLNAVLRSGFFPPYDPWFAGSTIKYYYFGFVIAGLPIKLLGIPSSIGYNLAIPMLFALTGGTAFGVAYNLVAPLVQESQPRGHNPSMRHALSSWPAIDTEQIRAALTGIFTRLRAAPEVIAGTAALLMSVILGNLGQIRTAVWGIAELGVGHPLWAVRAFPSIELIIKGLQALRQPGAILPVAIGEWYWNATRIIPVPINDAGLPTEIGPISEFPFFTFLYADLHAHMIAFMLTLFALVWGIALLRAPHPQQRGRALTQITSLLVGALIIGGIRPTNTWDWPTYQVVGIAIVALATAKRREDHAAQVGLVSGALAGGLGGLLLFFALQGSSEGRSLLPVLLTGAGIGFLVGYSIGVALVQTQARGEGLEIDAVQPWVTLLHVAWQAALLGGAGYLMFLPYHFNTSLQFSSIQPWSGSHTPLWTYLFIHGLMLFIVLTWLLSEALDWLHSRAGNSRLPREVVVRLLAAGILLGVVTFVLGKVYPAAIAAIPIATLALVLYFRREQPAAKQAVLLLVVFSMALSLMVEMIVIEGDIGRMNTVFKFYLQVWLMLAVSAGAAIGWLIPRLRRWHELISSVWVLGTAVLILLAALYPLLAARAKIMDRWEVAAPHTLDGMAYMPYATRGEYGSWFPLRGDYYALRWMQDNIDGEPVVLEGHTVEYNWGNRVSIYTGLPSVVGWANHQRQQRPPQSREVDLRGSLVDVTFNTTNTEYARQIIAEFGVDLVYIGTLERAYYDPAGLAKFEEMANEGQLALVYDRFDTQIYRVIKD